MRYITFMDNGDVHVSWSRGTGMHGAYYYAHTEEAQAYRNTTVMVGNRRKDII